MIIRRCDLFDKKESILPVCDKLITRTKIKHEEGGGGVKEIVKQCNIH